MYHNNISQVDFFTVQLCVIGSAPHCHFLTRAGQILHRSIILLVQQLNNNEEVNIAGYCIFIFINILQN